MLLDEAGTIWRSQKLQDFGWRAKVLGCPADATIQQLLRQIQLQTAELEELRRKQTVGLSLHAYCANAFDSQLLTVLRWQEREYQRPWWADGEYDTNRADR